MDKAIQKDDYEQSLHHHLPVLHSLRSEFRIEAMQHLLKFEFHSNLQQVQKLNKLTTNNHQGIVATISPISTKKLSDLENRINKNDPCLILILDGITDTKNFGAIIRSAECFGVDYIIISKTGSSPINGETIKSSSGAIFNTPICKVDHIKDAIFFLKEFGVEIIGSDDKAAKNLYKYKFKSKTAIIMGSEGDGINKSILNICDEKVNIPLHGKLSSLNVSVAAGIFLSEFKRQSSG